MKGKQKLAFGVFLCVLVFLGGLSVSQKKPALSDVYIGQDVALILKVMPSRDRKKLEWFFQEAIGSNLFGYVLLGEKPMAFDIYERKLNPFASLSAFRYAIHPRRIKTALGYKAWKKYQKFFPMRDFILLEEPQENQTYLYLIHRQAFVDKVNQHAKDFSSILGKEVKGKELLEESLKRPLLSEVLKSHDALLGILLGYGRDNAFLFYERSLFQSESEFLSFMEEKHLDSFWTDEEFEAFRKQFDSVSWVSRYITGSHMKNLDFMFLPSFVADISSEETKALKEQYLETKQKLLKHYQGKDFLETSLRLLMK